MRHANAIVPEKYLIFDMQIPETILDLAAEFLNKLAGCDFGKSLNVMVL